MRSRRPAGQRHQSVFREAWENMSADFSRFAPEEMRKSGRTRKVLILSAVIELIVLGAVGKFVYDWLTG